MQQQGIVTPEAVVLQFETAGIGSRIVAILIDFLLQLALLFIGILALGAVAGVSDTVATTLGFFLFFSVLFVYPAAFETLLRGRTPGKMALGLRVVTKEGAPVRFRHAAIRSALGLVDFYLTSGAGAVLSMLFTRDNQRLGDLAAGTIVLRERSGARAPVAVRFPVPYGYESYAATLDVSRVTAQEYQAARSFLLRAGQLAPSVRAELGARLASPLADRMHHRPPPGVSAEVFLACVAAGYQHRYEVLGPAPAPAWTGAPAGASVWGTAPLSPAPPAPAAPSAPAPSGPAPSDSDTGTGMAPPS